MSEQVDGQKEGTNQDAAKNFLVLIGGTLFLGLLAVGLAFLFKIRLQYYFFWRWSDLLIGIVATAPLAGFLFWFVKTSNPQLASFRESQIEFFAQIGFTFTIPRILLMGLGAGIFEELLFRGVFQTGAERFMPVIAAIIVTNIFFGLLHWRTVLYAVIAGILGAYLGIMFWLTGNLLAPMVTHTLYDIIALWYTRVAIVAYRAQKPLPASE